MHVPAPGVSADRFSVLKVMAVLGRTFVPGEDRAGNYVARRSSALWKKQFGGDPSVIGRAVALDGRSYTIIGVMPAGFVFPLDADPPQIWTTLSATATSLEDDKSMTEQ